MTISFSIDDLRKTLPGADALEGLDGEDLLQALTRLLGAVAVDAEVSFDGVMVHVVPREVGASAAAEAARLQDKAAARARQGEFSKAEAIYRRVKSKTGQA